MIDHKGSFYLGVFIFIIPFLGFPTMWKMVLVVIGGILLILTSLKVPAPRKIQKTKLKEEEENFAAPAVEIKPIEISKPVESVVVHEPVVEVPIIKIEREVKTVAKKPRKARIRKIEVK